MTATIAPAAVTQEIGSTARRSGRVLQGLVVAFLLFDALPKIAGVRFVREATAELGIPVHLTPIIGIVLLACVASYVVPRTAILGAVLLTGYFGGAVTVNLINETPLFSHVLFPVYVGVAVWAALWLRDRRVRSIVPFLTG